VSGFSQYIGAGRTHGPIGFDDVRADEIEEGSTTSVSVPRPMFEFMPCDTDDTEGEL